MRTVLQICQEAARRTGIPVPTTISSAGDFQSQQLGALLQEVVEYLMEHYNWQANRYVKTHSALATESQGSIYTLTGANFKRIVPNTMWNLTLKRPIAGPVTGVDRQPIRAFIPTGPIYTFWVIGDELKLNPTPTAGHSISFEWDSKDAWLAADGVTRKTVWTADNDTPLVDDAILIAGLRAFWKREKGQAYADLLMQFETLATDRCAKDGVGRDINLACEDDGMIRPGIFVAAGNTIPT